MPTDELANRGEPRGVNPESPAQGPLPLGHFSVYAAPLLRTSTATQNYLVYNTTTAPNGGGVGFLGLQTSNVTYQTLGTSGTPDYMLQVKVSGVPAVIWIPYIAKTYTLAPITAAMPAQSLGATN